MSADKLRARQQRFVDEYLIDCNGTRAAIAAGYTKRTAAQAAWEVLRNPKVAAEISRRQKRLAERHEVSADNVVSELSKLAFANLADFYRVVDRGRVEVDIAVLADPAKAAAVSQIEITENATGEQTVKIKLADKRAALNDLGRHLNLFNDRNEVAITVTSQDDELDIRDLALATLALLSDAAYRAPPKPLLIEASNEPEEEDRGDEVDFDLED